MQALLGLPLECREPLHLEGVPPAGAPTRLAQWSLGQAATASPASPTPSTVYDFLHGPLPKVDAGKTAPPTRPISLTPPRGPASRSAGPGYLAKAEQQRLHSAPKVVHVLLELAGTVLKPEERAQRRTPPRVPTLPHWHRGWQGSRAQARLPCRLFSLVMGGDGTRTAPQPGWPHPSVKE